MEGKGKGKKKQQVHSSDNMVPSSSTAAEPAAAGKKQDRNAPYEETRDSLILFFSVVKDISEATELLSPLKATCALIIRGLETTRTINKNKSDWADLTRKLEQHRDNIQLYIGKLDGKDTKSELSPLKPLAEYAQAIQDILLQALKAEKLSKPGFITTLKRVSRANMDMEEIQDRVRDANDAYQRFTESMNIITAIRVTEISRRIFEMHSDIRQLVRSSRSRRDGGSSQSAIDNFFRISYGLDLETCQEGTRVTVLSTIRDWANDSTTKKQIFWLKDLPGTGKTTIATTIAHEWLESGHLAGRFFFTPNSKAASNLKQFCPTVAQDMAVQLPSLGPTILSAVDATPVLHFRVQDQFRRMIIEPLKHWKHPAIFVFDALDHCDETGRTTLLRLLLDHLPSTPLVKVFLTSRPHPSIQKWLENSEMVTGQDIQLYSVGETGINLDIKLYIETQMYELTEEEQMKLILRSEGFFIWAATASRLFRYSYRRRPDEFLQRILSSDEGTPLDQLYLEVLRQALVDPGSLEQFMQILQIVTAAIEPVSIATIEVFLPNQRSVNAFVQDLCSVLKDGTPHRPIRVLHPTFREFIFHSARANGFLVKNEEAHSLLAQVCLKLLLDRLEYDIAKHHEPDQEIPYFNNKLAPKLSSIFPQSIYDALNYASSFWPQHVAQAIGNQATMQTLRIFLEKKFLNWLEVLSLCSLVPLALQGMTQLCRLLKNYVESNNSAPLTEDLIWCEDALSFLQRHQNTVTKAALHVYYSALPFTNDKSKIFCQYTMSNRFRIPQLLSGLRTPPAKARTLDGHTKNLPIWHIDISPDGYRIATGGGDRYTKIWDSESGACIANHLHVADLMSTHSPIFSPLDGAYIIIRTEGSRGGGPEHDFLLVCDGKSGHLTGGRLEANSGFITCSAISNDGRIVAAGFEDSTLSFWDMQSLTCIGRRIEGHNTAPRSLRYSPDGKTLASLARCEICIWNITSQVPHLRFRVTRDSKIQCLAFTPSGSNLAVGCQDGAISLFPLESAESTASRLPVEHKDAVTCCTFSDDGILMASGSDDHTIVIWEVETGRCLHQPLQGHSDWIVSITFTFGHTRLISVSYDGSMTFWDTLSGQVLNRRQSSIGGPILIARFSPNHKQLVTGHIYGRVIVWDLDESITNEAIDGEQHSESVGCLELSPSGTILASGSRDQTVRTWNLVTGQSTGRPIINHKSAISCVCFSPDETLIASGSEGGIIMLNMISDSSSVSVLEGHTDGILCLAFSPDAQLLASASTDCTIQIWETKVDNEQQRPLVIRGHTREVSCVVFTRDGKKILSGSKDGSVKLWHATSGVEIESEFSYSRGGMIETLTLSPNGKYFVVTIREALFNHIEVWRMDSLVFRSRVTDLEWRARVHFSEDSSCVWVGKEDWIVFSGGGGLNTLFHPRSNIWCDSASGWIFSIQSERHLFKLPDDIEVSTWLADKNTLVIGAQSGAVVVIDCERLFGN